MGKVVDAIADDVDWEEVDERAQEETEDVDSPDDDHADCAGTDVDDDADEGAELERDLRLMK